MSDSHARRSTWIFAGAGCVLGLVLYLLPVGREPAPDPTPDGSAAYVPPEPRGWSPARPAHDLAEQPTHPPDDPADFDLAQPLPAAMPTRAEGPPPSPSELHQLQRRRAIEAP